MLKPYLYHSFHQEIEHEFYLYAIIVTLKFDEGIEDNRQMHQYLRVDLFFSNKPSNSIICQDIQVNWQKGKRQTSAIGFG